MKADLHVHTMFSNDGETTMEELLDYAERKGIGCVAVTDHNEFRAFAELEGNGRIIVIPAEEVSSADGHIVALGIDRLIPRDRSIKETIDLIHEAGGYAFAAHPYRWWSGLGEKNTLENPFDGVEALNGRSVRRSNRRSEALAKRVGKPMTAGSDAHTPDHIGDGYVELPDGLETWQEVVACVMASECTGMHSSNRTTSESLRYGFKSITEWISRGFKRMRGKGFGDGPSAHQAGGPELRRDLVDRAGDVLRHLGAGADHLAGAEQQDDHLGVVQPVDQPGELLGLVLDFLEAERYGDRV